MDDLTVATIIFALTYVAIVSERINKTTAALLGGVAMILFRVIDQEEAFDAIDFNVIFLLIGMMVIANITGKTGAFQWLAIRSAKLTRGNPIAILVALCLITAVASAFLDNVTTVVLMAPLTLFMASSLGLSPLPFLISLIMASNIGGTATLIGDPPNILIGSAADLDFVSFLVNVGPIALIILITFLVAVVFFFRDGLRASPESRQRVMEIDESEVLTDRRLLAASVAVLAFTVVGFLLHSVLDYEVASVALLGAALLLIAGRQDPHDALREVEWPTIFFFFGLFMVVAGVEETGLLQDIGEALADASGGDLTLATMFILWPSALLSSIVNQIPYTAAMLPVVDQIGRDIEAPAGSANPLWWALVLGVGLGANLTIVGAAANVFIVNVAGRAGYKISFLAYLKYGTPVTLLSVAVAAVYVWLRYLAF
ncbi:MAG: SLC13 family permease [Dehalococcoidia bacterium]